MLKKSLWLLIWFIVHVSAGRIKESEQRHWSDLLFTYLQVVSRSQSSVIDLIYCSCICRLYQGVGAASLIWFIVHVSAGRIKESEQRHWSDLLFTYLKVVSRSQSSVIDLIYCSRICRLYQGVRAASLIWFIVHVSAGRIKESEQRRVLDEAARRRRQRKALEALEQDNFQDDPHADLKMSKKAPKFEESMEGMCRQTAN